MGDSGKRSSGSHQNGPSAKRSKKAYYRSAANPASSTTATATAADGASAGDYKFHEWQVHPGMTGFLCTTDGRPNFVKNAAAEALDLLFEYAELLYPGLVLRGIPRDEIPRYHLNSAPRGGALSQGGSGPGDETVNEASRSSSSSAAAEAAEAAAAGSGSGWGSGSGSLDFAAELNAELSDVRGKNKSKLNAFRCMRDLAKGYLVVECVIPEKISVDLIAIRIHNDWKAEKKHIKFVKSMIPFHDVCKAYVPDIIKQAAPLVEKALPRPPLVSNPISYAMDIRVKCSNIASVEELRRAIRGLIHPTHVQIHKDARVNIFVCVLTKFAFLATFTADWSKVNGFKLSKPQSPSAAAASSSVGSHSFTDHQEISAVEDQEAAAEQLENSTQPEGQCELGVVVDTASSVE
eukprot:ANDGO_02788.mRNA.1 hypothetical protein